MSKIIEFLDACSVFYVLTMNEDFPAGRPFGAVMEYQNDLYISTEDTKDVYHQLKKHSNMQVLALKFGTRDWLRMDGIVEECMDVEMKQRMLEECPKLEKHFPKVDTPHFVIFKVKVVNTEFHIG